MTVSNLPSEEQLRRRMLDLCEKLGLPAVECGIYQEWFGPDECGPAMSSMIAYVKLDDDDIAEGYGRTRLAAVADALRRLAELRYTRGRSLNRIFSPGEHESPEVTALMPLFRNKGVADVASLCASPEPYLRDLGMRLSGLDVPKPRRRRRA